MVFSQVVKISNLGGSFQMLDLERITIYYVLL